MDYLFELLDVNFVSDNLLLMKKIGYQFHNDQPLPLKFMTIL